jgi:hypothetical protein
MLSWLFTLMVSALVILAVGRWSSTFRIKDLSVAVLAAAAMSALGFAAGAPLGAFRAAVTKAVMGSAQPISLPSNASIYAWWGIDVGFDFVFNAMLLFSVALFVPGVTIRGAGGLLLIAALLAISRFFFRFPVVT